MRGPNQNIHNKLDRDVKSKELENSERKALEPWIMAWSGAIGHHAIVNDTFEKGGWKTRKHVLPR